MIMEEKEYKYKRKYITTNSEIKEYEQKIKSDVTDSELHNYINDVTKSASSKVKEIKRLENLLKVVLQYRGYNNKNNLDC
jgi:CHASE3 domain sensor protein